MKLSHVVQCRQEAVSGEVSTCATAGSARGQALHSTGFGKIPTLKAVGTELLKKRRLLFCLDPLSRHGFAESMGDVNNTFDNDQVFYTRWWAGNEASVYLDTVDRYAPEMGEGRKTCSEVIEREFDAGIVQT